jgi:glycosyltransferase A (GT-A) superfamily protein (DUF2064 family)
MTATRCLLVAKAPVPGRAKTRLGATIGHAAAAELAAASFLDSVAACAAAFGTARCVIALDGDLSHGVRGREIVAALRGWSVVGQSGEGLGERLARAHEDAGPGPVVQIGMDTPQVTPDLLTRLADLLADHDAAVGPAVDGGWWGLALRAPRDATVLPTVPMSQPDTGARTVAALVSAGLDVALGDRLRDVDTAADAEAVARACPGTRFAEAWWQRVQVAS